jgi:hypothetical protein
MTARKHSVVFLAVQIRIDFSDWYNRQSVKDQWIISDLAMGETINAVARKYGVSAGLISQFRRRYFNSWKRHIDPPEAGALVPA